MNIEEIVAHNYLEGLNIGKICYEPDGNRPPDFRLNKDIAIEVTRLNEHIEIQGKIKRLDDDRSAIISFIKRILHSFQPDFSDGQFWVEIKVKRPFGDRKKTGRKLNNLLSSFESATNIDCVKEYEVTDALSIKFLRCDSDKLSSAFRLGCFSEHDTGGWVGEEVLKNITYCINIKSSKIKPYINSYKEWWLVLVDTLAYGDYDEYVGMLKSSIDKKAFRKVIVLDRETGSYAFEI
ncbi:hypothetical protein [Aliivibrio fischeri]|uniref:hypothetical protein n=1 Tax=Aliivibrio fischeri TaxID=668 RepID=UPI00080DD8F2|nr:hypothetical protein [Aliivibrio fischeri]OCH39443.1 hypothetical protein A6D99_08545 [Aliivibrio fischeri]